jgi:hypothetical protein
MNHIEKDDSPEWYDEKAPENHFNAVPTGWREITHAEFLHKFCTYSFTHREYRQAKLPVSSYGGDRHPLESAYIFYYHGYEGVAMVPVVEEARYNRCRYFAFGCQHEWQEVDRDELTRLASTWPKLRGVHGTWGNCCHNYVCGVCGKYNFVDSSD